MRPHPFGIGVSSRALRISGEIDVSVAAQMLDAILKYGTSDDQMSMVLDLGAVTFIDSTGIGALLEAHQRLDAVGCRMLFENVPPCVSRVIGVTGLNEHLGIATTDSAAAN